MHSSIFSYRTLRASSTHESYPNSGHQSIGSHASSASAHAANSQWKGEALQRILAHKAQQKQRQRQLQSQQPQPPLPPPQRPPQQPQRIDNNNNYNYNHNNNGSNGNNSNNKLSSNSWTTLHTLSTNGP